MLELNKIYCGDCIEVMKSIDDNSIDAIVTDPPYGLEFMGKEWDKFNVKKCWDKSGTSTVGLDNTPRFSSLGKQGLKYFQDFCFDWAIEAYRVLKSGGYLLSFGGSRTYHRMACAIEDAGFEIRDCISWLYGQGFPKSLDVSKSILKTIENELSKQGINKIEWK